MAEKKITFIQRLKDSMEGMLLENGFKKTSKLRGMYFRMVGEIMQVILFDVHQVPVHVYFMASPYWSVNLEELHPSKALHKFHSVEDTADKADGHDNYSRSLKEPAYRRWEHWAGYEDMINSAMALFREKMAQHIIPLLDYMSDFDKWLQIYYGLRKYRSIDTFKMLDEGRLPDNCIELFRDSSDDIKDLDKKLEVLLQNGWHDFTSRDLEYYTVTTGAIGLCKKYVLPSRDKIRYERRDPVRLGNEELKRSKMFMGYSFKKAKNARKESEKIKWAAEYEEYKSKYEYFLELSKNDFRDYEDPAYKYSMERFNKEWGAFVEGIDSGKTDEELLAILENEHNIHRDAMKESVQQFFDNLKLAIVIE